MTNLSQEISADEGNLLNRLDVKNLLQSLPDNAPQCQASTTYQLEQVNALLTKHNLQDVPDLDKTSVANRIGMYDAADIFKLNTGQNPYK